MQGGFATITSVTYAPVSPEAVTQALLRRSYETPDKGEQLRWSERLSRAREWTQQKGVKR